MKNTLSMNQNLDIFRAYSKQMNRLDNLKSLIHKGCGVNRYLSPHRPIRMLKSLGGGNVFKLGGGFPVKRTAGGGKKYPRNSAVRNALKRLEYCGMLAVHR